MTSSLLMASIVEGLRARHAVFVGDENQLPPIGAGKPFRDMLLAGNIPTTRLTKNWRTDRQGIQQLCADMLTLDAQELANRFPDYVKAGGVEFVPCEWNERAGAAAMIVARLTDEGVSVEQIAILSPHKDGDAGCEAANLETRDVLGFDPGKSKKTTCLLSPGTTITRRSRKTLSAKRRFTMANAALSLSAAPIISIWNFPKIPRG